MSAEDPSTEGPPASDDPNTSGRKSARLSELPREATRWSFGAFFWGPIWGVFNGVWISLLALILPGIMNLVLLVKGRQWAWQAKRWDSPEKFHSAQKEWGTSAFVICGVAAFLLWVSIPYTTRVLQAQKINASKIAMASISFTLDVYRKDHGEYPEDLATLVRDGYLKEKQVLDPWNEEFKYQAQEGDDGFRTDFKLASKGPDRRDNTDDDIQCEGGESERLQIAMDQQPDNAPESLLGSPLGPTIAVWPRRTSNS